MSPTPLAGRPAAVEALQAGLQSNNSIGSIRERDAKMFVELVRQHAVQESSH
jgi:hypothetical protein